MENFNEGDLVVCVGEFDLRNDCPVPTKGMKYIVNSVDVCSGCKSVFLDIGFQFIINFPVGRCGECDSPSYNTTHVYSATAFRKITPPVKEYKIVEVCSELREEVKELIHDVTQKEKIDL